MVKKKINWKRRLLIQKQNKHISENFEIKETIRKMTKQDIGEHNVALDQKILDVNKGVDIMEEFYKELVKCDW